MCVCAFLISTSISVFAYPLREAVMKLQKHCSVINYSTDPPQYNSEGQGGGDDMITVLPAGETFPNR